MRNGWKARARRRGVSLVEVLIVVAIMSVVAGMAVMVAFPELRKARIRTAKMGAMAVREAAQTYREIDMDGSGEVCPSVQDLVAARKLDPKRSADPWGSSYAIGCESEEVHAISPGQDKKMPTPDDVRDDITSADVERIARM